MKGCRPLTDDEFFLIMTHLSVRDQCIFVLGIRTGFRISELLSLNVEDICNESGGLKPVVTLHKRNTKGKIEGRKIPIHSQVVPFLDKYIREENIGLNGPLFISKRGTRLDRTTYHRNFKRALEFTQIQGNIATHSFKKTFAKKFYDASGKDLLLTQQALGHKALTSTCSYLSVDSEVVEDLIKKLK